MIIDSMWFSYMGKRWSNLHGITAFVVVAAIHHQLRGSRHQPNDTKVCIRIGWSIHTAEYIQWSGMRCIIVTRILIAVTVIVIVPRSTGLQPFLRPIVSRNESCTWQQSYHHHYQWKCLPPSNQYEYRRKEARIGRCFISIQLIQKRISLNSKR